MKTNPGHVGQENGFVWQWGFHRLPSSIPKRDATVPIHLQAGLAAAWAGFLDIPRTDAVGFAFFAAGFEWVLSGSILLQGRNRVLQFLARQAIDCCRGRCKTAIGAAGDMAGQAAGGAGVI